MTVVENAAPAVCGEPAVVVTVRVEAAAGATVIAEVVPVIVAVTVSVAVIVLLPTVFRVVVAKVWAPLSPARKV